MTPSRGRLSSSRAYDDAVGRKRLSLATRSDLAIEAQISAAGATWLDRQLLAKEPALSSGGFGAELRQAMDRRIDQLVEQNLARRQGQQVILVRDLLNTLRRRELDEVVAKLSADTGLAHRPSAKGEHVSGIYRQRVAVASGRFAMIDDGLGFQLVPWRPALAEAGSAGVRHVDPWRRDRLELPAQARTRPVVTSSRGRRFGAETQARAHCGWLESGGDSPNWRTCWLGGGQRIGASTPRRFTKLGREQTLRTRRLVHLASRGSRI